MHITLFAIGRLKAGPERTLFDRYWERTTKEGRHIGLSKTKLVELPESRSTRANDRMQEEAQALLSKLPEKAYLIALDERGKTITSPTFSKQLAHQLDNGTSDFALIIGGADGLHEAIRKRANMVLSFGAMTWPHQMVRIMAAEQLYRAISIQKGHPYHKV